jgi:hypothetical protein
MTKPVYASVLALLLSTSGGLSNAPLAPVNLETNRALQSYRPGFNSRAMEARDKLEALRSGK